MELPRHKKEHIKIGKNAKFQQDWFVRNWIANFWKSEK